MRRGPLNYSDKDWKLDLGASVLDGRLVRFNLWAPFAKKVELILLRDDGESRIKMEPEPDGFHLSTVDAMEGERYAYLLDELKRRPDPVSRLQPDGVHKPSQVVDPGEFNWSDDSWKGLPLKDLLIYELHTGTFTEEGTFRAIIRLLPYLSEELGVTAIELMPVAQFPGDRNWGYDGVHPFAPQSSYGGPTALKELVNASHRNGLAVVLDVVYNHLGPEGNYMKDFGPYFSDKYRTPWGDAINYDDRGSDQVRRYFLDNACYWLTEYHIDALRLDAVHGIFDFSTKHILQEIGEAVHARGKALGREVSVIAESDLNDPRIIRGTGECGYGLDAQWSDDFHHSVHAYLTGERAGYYQDFGTLDDIKKAMTEGFVYDGRFSSYRGRRHGTPSGQIPPNRFVIDLQTHDQVGNRFDGARLSTLLDKEQLKVAAGLLLLGRNTPLLFMGEEYAERAPFYYFNSHGDPQLVEAVRQGRKKEFASHGWTEEPMDPQDPKTFHRSRIDVGRRKTGIHEEIFRHYKTLIRLRKRHPGLADQIDTGGDIELFRDERLLRIRRGRGEDELLLIYALGDSEVQLERVIGEGRWRKIYESTRIQPEQTDDFKIDGRTPIKFSPYSLTVFSRTL